MFKIRILSWIVLRVKKGLWKIFYWEFQKYVTLEKNESELSWNWPDPSDTNSPLCSMIDLDICGNTGSSIFLLWERSEYEQFTLSLFPFYAEFCTRIWAYIKIIQSRWKKSNSEQK